MINAAINSWKNEAIVNILEKRSSERSSEPIEKETVEYSDVLDGHFAFVSTRRISTR